MSSVQHRLQELFDVIEMPPGLKEDTLQKIAGLPHEQSKPDTSAILQSHSVAPLKARKRSRSVFWRTTIAAAACLLLCAVGLGGYSVYAEETALVGIEVNPSFELRLNRFDLIVATQANNEEGQLVLEDVALTGKSVDDAMTLLLMSEVYMSYLSDTSYMDISVACDDEQQSARLLKICDAGAKAFPCESACEQVDSQLYEEATDAGMGVRRYETALELIALDPGITLSDCQGMSMRELRQRIAEIDPESSYAWQGTGQRRGAGQLGGRGNGQLSGQGAGQMNGQGTGQLSGQGAGY